MNSTACPVTQKIKIVGLFGFYCSNAGEMFLVTRHQTFNRWQIPNSNVQVASIKYLLFLMELCNTLDCYSGSFI